MSLKYVLNVKKKHTCLKKPAFLSALNNSITIQVNIYIPTIHLHTLNRHE